MAVWFVWMLTFIDLDGGGRTLDFQQGREPLVLLGLEGRGGGKGEGKERWGGGGNY